MLEGKKAPKGIGDTRIMSDVERPSPSPQRPALPPGAGRSSSKSTPARNMADIAKLFLQWRTPGHQHFPPRTRRLPFASSQNPATRIRQVPCPPRSGGFPRNRKVTPAQGNESDAPEPPRINPQPCFLGSASRPPTPPTGIFFPRVASGDRG